MVSQHHFSLCGDLRFFGNQKGSEPPKAEMTPFPITQWHNLCLPNMLN
jgi:hypothetical protein